MSWCEYGSIQTTNESLSKNHAWTPWATSLLFDKLLQITLNLQKLLLSHLILKESNSGVKGLNLWPMHAVNLFFCSGDLQSLIPSGISSIAFISLRLHYVFFYLIS
jgi:hypothetical protein